MRFPRPGTAWNPADYAQYLKPTSRGPVDGEVKKLSEVITKGKRTVLEKAKAIYDWISENTYRDPDTIGCGIGDVERMLAKLGGKCTDISSLFIALVRAAGVPARELFSVRLGKKSPGGHHDLAALLGRVLSAWLRLGAGGPADVRKAMLVEKLELKDAKTADYRDYFWGGIDAYGWSSPTGATLC